MKTRLPSLIHLVAVCLTWPVLSAHLARASDGSPSPADETGALSGVGSVTTASGLRYQILEQGSGRAARNNANVKVHYTIWLTDGKKVDSSLDRKQPFSFRLGSGQVIKGLDEGTAGMKIGSKRKLTVPSNLAYGAGGAGGQIPPNATLIIEIEMLGVE